MNVGGPALQVVAMARHIDPANVQQLVLSGSVAGDEQDYLSLRAPDIKVTTVPGLGRSVKGMGDLRAFLFVCQEIRRFRPHIVHTHTAKAGVLGRLAAKVLRVPFVIHTFHGHLLNGYFSPRVLSLIVGTERTLAKGTTKIVSVGEQVREDLLHAGIGRRDQYLVVAPGVVEPVDVDPMALRAELSLGPDTVVVVFVGRLTQIKRAERYVELAKSTIEELPDAVFLVVGDGPDRESLETAAASLGSRVRFLGWRGDIASVYAAADIATLTSDNEGMPVALIEASMQGVPSVSTDVGSVRQVVEDSVTGYVVADMDALREKFLLLAHDRRMRVEFGVSAQQRARRLFSEKRLAKDIESLYEAVARSS
jgi:glycosyltransferase involved in cell wall biosynthesis